MIRRREFVTLLGGAAAWPFVARAQQGERMRRIGVLMARAESDAAFQTYLQAFRARIQELGWTEGNNVRIDYRWTAGILERFGTAAAELVALKPDVILADATPSVAALRMKTKTIPIVFVTVNDPIGSGFVESFPRPGGTITGFTNFFARRQVARATQGNCAERQARRASLQSDNCSLFPPVRGCSGISRSNVWGRASAHDRSAARRIGPCRRSVRARPQWWVDDPVG